MASVSKKAVEKVAHCDQTLSTQKELKFKPSILRKSQTLASRVHQVDNQLTRSKVSIPDPPNRKIDCSEMELLSKKRYLRRDRIMRLSSRRSVLSNQASTPRHMRSPSPGGEWQVGKSI